VILLYHHVCPDAAVPGTADADSIEGWEYRLRPEDLAFQVERLRQRGFRFVSLDEYVHRAVDADLGPGRMLAVTFDDGWRDNHTHALPVLTELGVPATFFVVSGPLGTVPDERRMTPGMLRDLLGAGMEIGAHSRTHPDLPTLSEARLDEEIGGCRADLEGLLGQPVRFLAYPGGGFDDRVVRCVERHRFRAACSVIPAGRNDGSARFRLSRDVLSPRLDRLRDRILLHSAGRWIWRLRRRSGAPGRAQVG
jgi:peptidoglycan/xylan/chitin deacetylase (PgdA/CDA1 family)